MPGPTLDKRKKIMIPRSESLGNLQIALLQALIDINKTYSPAFPSSVQAVLNSGGYEYNSITDKKFNRLLSGYLYQARKALQPSYVLSISGYQSGDSVKCALTIEGILNSILSYNPGYAANLSYLLSTGVSASNKILQACIVYCAKKFAEAAKGAAITDSVAYQSVSGSGSKQYLAAASISHEDGGMPPPSGSIPLTVDRTDITVDSTLITADQTI